MIFRRIYRLTVPALLLWAMFSFLSCGDDSPVDPDDPGNGGGIDTIPPAALIDLKAVAISDTEFKLTWTAPRDNHMTGTAMAYDLRYFLTPMTSSGSWSPTNRVTGAPTPLADGSPDSFVVTG